MDSASPTSASSGAAPEGLSVGSIPAADGPSPEGPDQDRGDPFEGGGGSGFVAATLDELGKVVWPSRQQLVSESVGVILMVVLSAAAIAAIDRFYHWASAQVFR